MVVAGVPVVRNTRRPERTSHTRIADAVEKLYPQALARSDQPAVGAPGDPAQGCAGLGSCGRLSAAEAPDPHAADSVGGCEQRPVGAEARRRGSPPPASASGSANRRFPVLASQTVAVPSSPPVAIRAPFGL